MLFNKQKQWQYLIALRRVVPVVARFCGQQYCGSI